MRISIAMATYNGAAYLDEQLQSFVDQTTLPDELVVSDDSSSDESCQVVEAFASRSPFPVVLIRNDENAGYSANFNRALSSCQGDIVFLSDQDDVWLPEKIERILSEFNARPDTQLIIHDLDYCKEDLTPIGQTKIERMRENFDLEKSYVVGMATAIRGDFLRLCLPIPDKPGITHDSWLHACAQAIGGKTIINSVLAMHRRHPSNVTASGDLNVDYVTGASHFKRKQLKLLLTGKTMFDLEAESALEHWLLEARAILVQKGYISSLGINELIRSEQARLNNIRERNRIRALPRLRRILPAAGMYLSGGYGQFSGLKSAAKDILLK